MDIKPTLDFARDLDRSSSYQSWRNEFILPVVNGQPQIYFLGNSLGLQPKKTGDYIKEVLDQWSSHGVESFFMGSKPWLAYHQTLAEPLSAIVGALPHEIVVMNQLTVNLHLMMVSFYRPSGKRKRILCEAKAFPSDQYMFETHIRYLGLDPSEILIELGPRQGEHCIRQEDLLQAIHDHRDELALVLWGGLNYYTGQVFDMKSVTEAGHAAGAIVGFDLAHAAGNIPLQLHDWDVDFACWCNYKYLNAGPGAIGGVYIHEKFHQDTTLHRLAGWWGYKPETRFLMEKGFVPTPTAEGWQLSTPSILLYACLKASLDLFANAGMPVLHQRREQLNEYLWTRLDAINELPGNSAIEFITPRGKNEKGCQVSMLMLKNGREVYDGLMKKGIIVDWREPNVIRLAPVPLYNNFEEIWHFTETLKDLIAQ